MLAPEEGAGNESTFGGKGLGRRMGALGGVGGTAVGPGEPELQGRKKPRSVSTRTDVDAECPGPRPRPLHSRRRPSPRGRLYFPWPPRDAPPFSEIT